MKKGEEKYLDNIRYVDEVLIIESIDETIEMLKSFGEEVMKAGLAVNVQK